MIPTDIHKAVVITVVGTAAFVTVAGVMSVAIAMLCQIKVEPILLQTIVQSSATAGGGLLGILIKTSKEEKHEIKSETPVP